MVKKKDSVCGQCAPKAKRGSPCKEARIAAELEGWALTGIIPRYTSWNKTTLDTNPAICGRYRPDFVWDLQHRAVILEVDEHQHKTDHYIPHCELVRMARIVEGFGGIPVHIIRYNPDAFKIKGVTRTTRRGERVALLKDQLSKALAEPDFEHVIVLQYLWFDQEEETAEFATAQYYKTLEEYEEWVSKKCSASD